MRLLILLIFLILTIPPAQAETFRNIQLESQIEALFPGNRDLADIKLTVDRMVEPSIDIGSARAMIDAMSADLDRMSVGAQGSLEKLKVLKRYIYEPGTWNGNRPFQYDRDDPLGQKPENRLLTDYLADRRGNCVSMPILFIILGDRMGLKMTLAEAPLHVFVKFTDDDGQVWSLETTSGAGFTRDSHYRTQVPMSDRAIESGIYMRALSRQEVIASMVSLLVEDRIDEGRFEDAIVASDVLLRHAPRSVYVMLKRGSAYGGLLKRDVIAKYKTSAEMAPEIKAYADGLYQENLAAFEKVEALGWREQDGQL